MQPDRGPAADHCPDNWPNYHLMVAHMPAGTTIAISRCVSCDWIDGADLAQQETAAELRGFDRAVALLRDAEATRGRSEFDRASELSRAATIAAAHLEAHREVTDDAA